MNKQCGYQIIGGTIGNIENFYEMVALHQSYDWIAIGGLTPMDDRIFQVMVKEVVEEVSDPSEFD